MCGWRMDPNGPHRSLNLSDLAPNMTIGNNPQIGLLFVSDLFVFFCDSCRYCDLYVSVLGEFYDFGELSPSHNLNSCCYLYYAVQIPKRKTHVPIILDMWKCQNYRKPTKIIENHRNLMVVALTQFSNPIFRLTKLHQIAPNRIL